MAVEDALQVAASLKKQGFGITLKQAQRTLNCNQHWNPFSSLKARIQRRGLCGILGMVTRSAAKATRPRRRG